jgi:2'-5' RNA ligase
VAGRTLRLYFALWPDDELRQRIAQAAAGAVAAAGGRAVPSENLHVTLAFLGAVAAERYPDAVAAARGVRAAPGVQAFDRIVAWGRSGPLVLEATRVATPLAVLHDALRNSLNAAGFALDERGFRPHITLSRRPERRPDAAPDAAVHWAFDAFVLVESETRPEGSRYVVTETFPLR